MRTVLCVNCDNTIDYDKDNYEVGVSIGEYWCRGCVSKENQTIESKGTKLEHYKGGKYTVIGLSTHSETLEEMLVYQNDKDKKVWVRPINMFYENVEYKGKYVPRFKVVESDNM